MIVLFNTETYLKKELVKDGRTLKALSKKGHFTYPIHEGHKYIDEKNNPKVFFDKGIKYSIEYGDGCFYPYLFRERT